MDLLNFIFIAPSKFYLIRNIILIQKGLFYERKYSGHSIERIQERGLTPIVVEDAIKTGTRTPGKRAGTFVHLTDKAKIVTNDKGDVITVIPL